MYQNLDLRVNKFFLHRDGTRLTTDIRELKNNLLDRNVYFRPSACPLINVNDSDAGSCFEEYTIPTASFQFYVNNNKVKSVLIEKNIRLDDYVNTLHQKINSHIQDIYQQHATVTLAYSGGIDSMVLLSSIQSQNLLSRTDIVCFKNQTQSNLSCLHQDPNKLAQVTALLDSLKPQARSITWLTITHEDFISSVNNQLLEHSKCYATNAVLQRTNGCAYIFGHHGNQTLLHKNIFVDEIILNHPGAVDELQCLTNGPKTFYTQSLLDVDTTRKIGIERRHMLMKPWSFLNSNSKVLYSPLADNLIFDQLRRLDYGQISISTIANADVAREIINRNVGTILDSYITTETVKDGDNLENMEFTLDSVNKNLLKIPTNLTHSPEGLEYIQHELMLATKSNSIHINTLVSIKTLNWLSLL
jgi:hypothetical protein